MQPKWFSYLYPVSYVYPTSSSGGSYPASSSSSSSSPSSVPQPTAEDQKLHSGSHARNTARTGRGRQSNIYIDPVESSATHSSSAPQNQIYYCQAFQPGSEAGGMNTLAGPGAQGWAMPMFPTAPSTARSVYDHNIRAAFDRTNLDDVEENIEEESLELSSCMQRRLHDTLGDSPRPQQQTKKRVSFSSDTEDCGPLYDLEFLAAFPDFRRSADWRVNVLGLLY